MTEIKLGEVTVKVLLFALLIDAFHAAFENREIAFDRIGVDGETIVIAGVFAGRVLHGFMLNEYMPGASP